MGVGVDGYISYCSNAMTKYPDKGNLEKEIFNWAYDFKGLECMMVEQRLGVRSI